MRVPALFVSALTAALPRGPASGPSASLVWRTSRPYVCATVAKWQLQPSLRNFHSIPTALRSQSESPAEKAAQPQSGTEPRNGSRKDSALPLSGSTQRVQAPASTAPGTRRGISTTRAASSAAPTNGFDIAQSGEPSVAGVKPRGGGDSGAGGKYAPPPLDERDLEESFVKGSGAGGQKINKTSNCVLLRHIPSGIVVRCQESRSQHRNRSIARTILQKKLDEIERGAQSLIAQEASKARARKARRRRKSVKKHFKSRRDKQMMDARE